MNRDFRDLLSAFAAHDVEYIVVGAHALAAYGHVRATKDLDVWVKPHPRTAHKVLRALRAFGAPLQDLTSDDLSREGVVFQIGVAPVRIDIVTSVDGLEFEDAWRRRVETRFAGVPAFVLAREDLIANKRATGRPQARMIHDPLGRGRVSSPDPSSFVVNDALASPPPHSSTTTKIHRPRRSTRPSPSRNDARDVSSLRLGDDCHRAS